MGRHSCCIEAQKSPNWVLWKAQRVGGWLVGQTVETRMTKASDQVDQPGAHIFVGQVRSGMSKSRLNIQEESRSEQGMKAHFIDVFLMLSSLIWHSMLSFNRYLSTFQRWTRSRNWLQIAVGCIAIHGSKQRNFYASRACVFLLYPLTGVISHQNWVCKYIWAF